MSESRKTKIPWLRGILYGAVTYLVALMFTILWAYYDHLPTILNVEVEKPGEFVGLAIAAFYEAQFVLTYSVSYEGGAEIEFIPFLIRFGPGGRGYLTPWVYYVIPAVLILIISAVFVYFEMEGTDRLKARVAGESLAIGYVALSLVVVLAIRFAAGVELPIVRVVVIGILYAAVLGGVGGIVANEIKSYQTTGKD